MVDVLDELQLTELVCSIVGLSALGGATILAETGDLPRFASARAVVKHSGLAPREKSSGTYTGRTKLTGARTARTTRGCLAGSLGSPKDQPCLCGQVHPPDQQKREQTQPWASPRSHRCRVAAPAARGRDHTPEMGRGHRRRRQMRGDRTSRLSGSLQAGSRREPHAASRNHGYLAGHHRQPRPSSDQPDYTLLGPPQLRLCRDRRQARHRPKA